MFQKKTDNRLRIEGVLALSLPKASEEAIWSDEFVVLVVLKTKLRFSTSTSFGQIKCGSMNKIKTEAITKADPIRNIAALILFHQVMERLRRHHLFSESDGFSSLVFRSRLIKAEVRG